MSFVGLYSGLSGIRAAQTGIDVTSNNVANVSTPGYTRQRVEQSSAPSYDSAVGRQGTGVSVDEIGRLRDAFLDDRFRNAIGEHGAATVRADTLKRLEGLTGEPDEGVSVKMESLWAAAEAWANDPEDPSTRRQLLGELSSVSDTIRSVASAWDSLGADVTNQLETTATIASDRLASLDELNRSIVGANPARIGPELLDQRDALMDEVAGLTGATVRIDSNGRAVAELDGVSLLSANGAATIGLVDGPDGPRLEATLPNGDTATLPSGRGELGGLHRVLTQDLADLQGELDQFAETFAGAVNAINRAGLTADGNQGGALLEFDAGNAAGSLRLVSEDLQTLAAARGTAQDPPVAPSPHDNSNARAFADLRTTTVADDGTPGAGSKLESRFADLVTGLAGDVRSSKASADAARTTARGAEMARAAEHGVSIDEEMVNLVRYQRGLEAAARVMTTVDEALEVLVNRTGVVGR